MFDNFTHQQNAHPTAGQQIPSGPGKIMGQRQQAYAVVKMRLHDGVLLARALGIVERIVFGKEIDRGQA